MKKSKVFLGMLAVALALVIIFRKTVLFLVSILLLHFTGTVSYWAGNHSLPQSVPFHVTYEFEYKGEAYKTSFLTVLNPTTHSNASRSGYYYTWAPEQKDFQIILKDGSLLYVRNESQGMEFDREFEKYSKATTEHEIEILESSFPWVWFDNPENPQTVVMNISSEQKKHPEYANNEWTSYISHERVLITALASKDLNKAKQEDVEAAAKQSYVVRASFDPEPRQVQGGRLFVSLNIQKLDANSALYLRNLLGWRQKPGGCDVIHPTSAEWGRMPRKGWDRIQLWLKYQTLLNGDTLPLDPPQHPGSPPYYYPQILALFPVAESSSLLPDQLDAIALKGNAIWMRIKNVSLNNRKCAVETLPQTAVRFGDDIFVVGQGMGWVALSDKTRTQ